MSGTNKRRYQVPYKAILEVGVGFPLRKPYKTALKTRVFFGGGVFHYISLA